MKLKQKENITKQITHLATLTSQNRVAMKVGISSAAISQIINKNWDFIGAPTWLLIEARLKLDSNWTLAETSNFKGLRELLRAAQEHSLSLGISFSAGSGKSYAFNSYANENKNVYLIEAANYWTKREYIIQLLATIGLKPRGTTSNMVQELIRKLNSTHKPLLIIDQFDKLRDPSMDLFMDMYNETHHRCGFILSGVEALEKRIMTGIQLQRIGYQELFSRIGRKFIKLNPLTRDDVWLICNANGIDDEETAVEIFNSSDGDLRRVRRSIEQLHLLAKTNKRM